MKSKKLYNKLVNYLFSNYDKIFIVFDELSFLQEFAEMFTYKSIILDEKLGSFTVAEFKTDTELRQYFLRFDSFIELFFIMNIGEITFEKDEKNINISSQYNELNTPVHFAFDGIDENVKNIFIEYESSQ